MLEELFDQLEPEFTFAVHLLNVGADFVLGKLARRRPEHPLFFGQNRQRLNERCKNDWGIGHKCYLRRKQTSYHCQETAQSLAACHTVRRAATFMKLTERHMWVPSFHIRNALPLHAG